MNNQSNDLSAIKAMLSAAPPGVIEPGGLCFTRLGPDGGALHTGGADGIVYSACRVASVDQCPEELDPAIALITAAPALVASLVAELEGLRAAAAVIGREAVDVPELGDGFWVSDEDFARLMKAAGLVDPPERVIFLDVDGVLNHTAWHLRVDAEPWSEARHWDRQLDPSCVARVNRLAEASGAAVVLSSTWRDKLGEPEAALRRSGLVEWIGRTPGGGPRRGNEIQAWMSAHGLTADRIVILDDDSDMEHLAGRLVRIDHAVGLTDADVELALRLLDGGANA